MIDAPTLPTISTRPGQIASLSDLAAIPEEEVWLASQKSARTRRAYQLDVAHFMRCLAITTPEQLRQVDHRPVIAWERIMREEQGALPSTVRHRLAALSSLFKHLVRHGAASRNPVADVKRPSINREEGTTLAFQGAGSQAARRPDRGHAGGPAGSRHPLGRPPGGATAGGDRSATGGRPTSEPRLRRAAPDPQGRAA